MKRKWFYGTLIIAIIANLIYQNRHSTLESLKLNHSIVGTLIILIFFTWRLFSSEKISFDSKNMRGLIFEWICYVTGSLLFLNNFSNLIAHSVENVMTEIGSLGYVMLAMATLLFAELKQWPLKDYLDRHPIISMLVFNGIAIPLTVGIGLCGSQIMKWSPGYALFGEAIFILLICYSAINGSASLPRRVDIADTTHYSGTYQFAIKYGILGVSLFVLSGVFGMR